MFRSTPLIAHEVNGVNLPHNMKQEDYTPVGSWLPTVEYLHAFDILEQFMGSVKGIYNVPRPIQAWDAINLCPLDPPGIKTLLVIPADYVSDLSALHPQFKPGCALALITTPHTFQSFRHPMWPNIQYEDN